MERKKREVRKEEEKKLLVEETGRRSPIECVVVTSELTNYKKKLVAREREREDVK